MIEREVIWQAKKELELELPLKFVEELKDKLKQFGDLKFDRKIFASPRGEIIKNELFLFKEIDGITSLKCEVKATIEGKRLVLESKHVVEKNYGSSLFLDFYKQSREKRATKSALRISKVLRKLLSAR